VTEPLPFGEPQPPPPPPPVHPVRRLLGPLIAVGAALLKWGAVLFKLKFFTLFASMIASMWAYAWLYGWKFAVGFVVLIAIHELGHVIVLRMRGIEAGLPVFLPFLGAFVAMKQAPRTVYDEALSGIAGPVFGVAASFGALGLSEVYDSELMRVLAYTGFFMNLFNLLPIVPLDGGRTAAALSPKLWFVGVAGLLAYEVWRPSPIIPLILVLAAFEGWRRWKGRNAEAARTYYALSHEQRLQIGTAYVGLILVILWAMHAYPLPPR
jgi:Zn-dependent protease